MALVEVDRVALEARAELSIRDLVHISGVLNEVGLNWSVWSRIRSGSVGSTVHACTSTVVLPRSILHKPTISPTRATWGHIPSARILRSLAVIHQEQLPICEVRRVHGIRTTKLRCELLHLLSQLVYLMVIVVLLIAFLVCSPAVSDCELVSIVHGSVHVVILCVVWRWGGPEAAADRRTCCLLLAPPSIGLHTPCRLLAPGGSRCWVMLPGA